MASAIVTKAQNFLTPETEDVSLGKIYGSLSVGDVCRYRLSIQAFLKYEEVNLDYKKLFSSPNYFITDTKDSDSQKGWDLRSVPENLTLSVNNTSPIRKNLSLLKQEGPYTLSVLIKPEKPISYDSEPSYKREKAKKNQNPQNSNNIYNTISSDSNLRIKNKKNNSSFFNRKNERLSEKPASTIAILCGASWSTKLPFRDLVVQEVKDLVFNKQSRRVLSEPSRDLKLQFSYSIDVISEVILPPAAVSFEINLKASKLSSSPTINAYATIELVSDTASLFKLPDPSIFKEEAETGIHLVVLSHGLHGSRNDLLYLHEQINLKSTKQRQIMGADGNRRVVVLSHDVNHGNTTDGIEAGGKRIAAKILEYVSWFYHHDFYSAAATGSSKQLPHRISFIGHSLGGLYNLNCLEFLNTSTNKDFFKVFEPINFITIATPWLGIFEMGNVAQLACSWGILKQTGKDLVLGYPKKNTADTPPSPETSFVGKTIEEQSHNSALELNISIPAKPNQPFTLVDYSPGAEYKYPELTLNQKSALHQTHNLPGQPHDFHNDSHIFKLSDPNSITHKTLRLFKNHTAYANSKGDWEVGFLTSSLLLDPKNLDNLHTNGFKLDTNSESKTSNANIDINADVNATITNSTNPNSNTNTNSDFNSNTSNSTANQFGAGLTLTNNNGGLNGSSTLNTGVPPGLADHSIVTSASNPWHVKLVIDPLYSIFRRSLSIIGLADNDRDNLVRRETDVDSLSSNSNLTESDAQVEPPNSNSNCNSHPSSNSNHTADQLDAYFSESKAQQEQSPIFYYKDSEPNCCKNSKAVSQRDKSLIFLKQEDSGPDQDPIDPKLPALQETGILPTKKNGSQSALLKSVKEQVLVHHEYEYKLWSLNPSDNPIILDTIVPESDMNQNVPCYNHIEDFGSSQFDFLANEHMKLPGGFAESSIYTDNEGIYNDSTPSSHLLEQEPRLNAGVCVDEQVEAKTGEGLHSESQESGDKNESSANLDGHNAHSTARSQQQSPNYLRYNLPSSTTWIRRIAQNWHTLISWRTVVVKFDFDAHHEIIVRREGSNYAGMFVIHHCLDNHDLY